MDYNAANLAQQQGLSYQDFAVQAAQAYGVPTDLFIKQIGQESGFNPKAQNGNAMGIAQIMPGTAADLGVDPNNPYQSIQAAAYYDNQLYQKSHSWAQVMQAYGTTANGAGSSVAALASQIDASSAPNYSDIPGTGQYSSYGPNGQMIIGMVGNGPVTQGQQGTTPGTNPQSSTGLGLGNMFSIDWSKFALIILGIVLIAFALWQHEGIQKIAVQTVRS